MGVREFFQTIQWRATLQVALIRVALASILWPLVLIIFGSEQPSALFSLMYQTFGLLLIFMVVAIPAIGLASANIPFVGLAALPAWLVVIADPVVKIVHSMRPDWVPVDEFKLVNPPVLGVFGSNEQYEDDLDLPLARDEKPISTQSPDSRTPSVNLAKTSIPKPDSHQTATGEAQRIYEEGLRLFQQGEKKQGLVRVNEALRVDPHHVEANLFIASAFCTLDPVKHSGHILLTTGNVLAVDPDNKKAINLASAMHFALGKQAWDAEDWGKATDAFTKSYKLDPTTEHLPEALAHCAENGSALPVAIAAFEEQIEKHADDDTARLLAGRSYMKLALDEQAREKADLSQEEAIRRGEGLLTAVIQHDPQNSDANYWLAPAYVMTNRDNDARKIIEILRSIAPERASEVEAMMA